MCFVPFGRSFVSILRSEDSECHLVKLATSKKWISLIIVVSVDYVSNRCISDRERKGNVDDGKCVICIVALWILIEWNWLQKCSNGGTSTSH